MGLRSPEGPDVPPRLWKFVNLGLDNSNFIYENRTGVECCASLIPLMGGSMENHTIFGDFIRDERDRAGLGLREASRALGMSASYLSRLEAGEFRPPSGTILLRMAQVYRSDIKKLMDLSKNRHGEVMTADESVAPAVQAFYRLAHDQ